MDSLSGHSGAFDTDGELAEGGGESAAVAIGTDERRMHVRAYNHWVSLLDGRDYPSIEDLDPASITDFAPHSVLLDFTAGRDNPATPYIGTAIREECDLAGEIARIDQVPSRSLLSRLTDHYMQIIANRAPIGFEAEFVNQRGVTLCYRGILMPFSSDGDTIDFIYGVINWKTVGADTASAPVAAIPAQEPAAPETEDPHFIPDETPVPHLHWDDGPLADDEEAAIVLDEEAGLADRLWAARESAEACKQSEGRSRAALYRALAMAYDFAVAAKRVPDDYAEILADAGVKSQARAPMTPIVKLVFGIDYDKTRLTEFAAAMSYAERCEVDFGGFQAFLDEQGGGLKALVAAERQARRPASKPDTRGEQARAELRRRQPIAMTDINGDDEFVLVLSRRTIGGGTGYEAIALIDDGSMVDRAIRRAAR